MKYFLLILVFFISSCSSPEPGTDEWFKEKHKELLKADPEVNLSLGEFKDIFSSETGINKSQALNQIINREETSPECLLFIGDTYKDQMSAKESSVKFAGIENDMSNFLDDYGIKIKNMNELYIGLSKIKI